MRKVALTTLVLLVMNLLAIPAGQGLQTDQTFGALGHLVLFGVTFWAAATRRLLWRTA